MAKRKCAKMRRLSLSLPVESVERLKVHAIRRRESASELVRRLVDLHLRDVWIAERASAAAAADPPQLRVQSH